MRRVYQKKENIIEAVYIKDLLPSTKDTDFFEDKKSNGLIKGELYSLKSASCDGFEMEENIYMNIGVIHEHKGIPIDCAIMKQVSGKTTTIYQMTKEDCKIFGVPYEDKLQLFPIDFGWKRVNEPTPIVVPFNPNNLATYPTEGNILSNIILKVGGFKNKIGGTIQTPSGYDITDFKNFFASLTIDIYIDAVERDFNLKYQIITSSVQLHNLKQKAIEQGVEHLTHLIRDRKSIIDEDGFIYFLVSLEELKLDKKYFENKAADTVFEVSWLEKTAEEKAAEEEARKQAENTRAFARWNLHVSNPYGGYTRISTPSTFEENMIRTLDGRHYEVFKNGTWIKINR